MKITILTTGGTIDKTYNEFDGSLRNAREIGDGLAQKEFRVLTINPGKAKGKLLGGNLSVMAAMVGSDYLPDFIKMAEAHGAAGIRVAKKNDMAPALRKAMAIKGPVVLECIVKGEENVYPMVPPGASLTEMIQSMA